jgi:hypothetical protein
MNMKLMSQLLGITCLISGVILISPQLSASEQEDGTTGAYLKATLRNGPAMAPVTWKVFRLDNQNLVKTTSAHSFSLPLAPGNYKAVVELNNVTRDRLFTVMDNSKVDVVIAMDQ